MANACAAWVGRGQGWDEYRQLTAGSRDLSPSEPSAAVADEFLEWVQNEKSALTYAYYKRHLESFAVCIGPRLPVSELRPLHITRWVGAKYAGCGETTRNSAISMIQRTMNWAVKQGIIDRSPIFGMEKPPRKG